MYFWLNYCDENHVERIPIAVKIINHLFHLASEIMDADTLNLFLFFDGTRIDENEHLSSLESGTELSARRNKSQNCWSILNWKDV